MRSIEENAKRLTKKVRRDAERKRDGVTKAAAHVHRKPKETPLDVPAPEKATPVRTLKPFDDTDDMENG